MPGVLAKAIHLHTWAMVKTADQNSIPSIRTLHNPCIINSDFISAGEAVSGSWAKGGSVMTPEAEAKAEAPESMLQQIKTAS